MLKFTFLKSSKQWAVVGPVEEMRLGYVQVPRKDGKLKTERIVKLLTPFPDSEGQMLRCGLISPLPWGGK